MDVRELDPSSEPAVRQRLPVTRRSFLLASAALGITTLLAACGGDDDAPPTAAPQATQATGGTGTSPTATSAGGVSSAGTTPQAQAANPTAAASPATTSAAPGRPGGKKIFRVAFGGDIQNMDSAAITSDPDNQAGEAVYNYIARYTYNPPLGTEILPDLAEKWDTSPDAKVFTFYLRKNATFHKNYGTLTAEDVKWNWERIQDEKTASRFRTDFLGGTFQVIDPTTLKATFDRAYPAFIPAALGYVSGLIMSKKAFEELGDKWKTGPIGTGPFQWGKYEPGNSLTLDRFDGYWGQKPKVDQIYLVLKADFRAALLAISKGELDATYIDDTDLALEFQKKNDPNMTINKASSGQAVNWLAYNMKRPPLDNVVVRQALRYAIDVDAIAKDLYGGLADPVHSFLPPFMWGFTNDVMKFNYDPDKAKQMLKDAGVDLNTWQPSILGSSTSIYATKLNQAVASYWNDVGVKARNDLLEQGVFLQRRAAGDYDMFSIGPGRIEPDQIATAYFRTGSTVNNSFYSGADDLIDAARAEPDRTKRADLYKQLQQRIAIDSPCAFLVAPNSSLALNKRVAGIAGAGWLHRYDWFNVDVPAE